ncbi:PIG-L family deacetylase [Glaciihabitans sp. UYNi722]|uniref:PIG-L deacetylase family protein n=1 Tax=Glaciihabitans sp. UYNi722 TaxID=3156344 RepID=UPI00339A1F98
MVTFDSRTAGTSAEIWNADARRHRLPELRLEGIDELIVIAAHPDDETLGAGGLIAECSIIGIPIHVVVVTDGAGSHPHSTTVTPVGLAVRRRRETTNAVRRLAPAAVVTFLDFGDGTIRENREQVRIEVDCIVAKASQNALLVAPWRGDGHRDHRILGEVTAEANAGRGIRFLEYPIWLWHWSSPELDSTPWKQFSALRMSESTLAAKNAAIRLHESQVAPLSAAPGDEAVLDSQFLRNFEHDAEVFIAPER